jgi:DNA-binding NarL/FixJ family response regulator
MARLLLVDDAEALTNLFGRAVSESLGHEVVVVSCLDDLNGVLTSDHPFELALVDLSFPGQQGSGIDGLVEIQRCCPTTRLAIITQGDEWVADVLRDAWELLPITTVISKSAPFDYQLQAIRRVLRDGTAPIDPAIQPLIPSNRNPWRTPETFASLVQHAGHAKLWNALIDAEGDLSYRSIAAAAGLKLNTIKNYRAQLIGELALHGMTDPSLVQMRSFALRCRSFLQPYIDLAIERSRT